MKPIKLEPAQWSKLVASIGLLRIMASEQRSNVDAEFLYEHARFIEQLTDTQAVRNGADAQQHEAERSTKYDDLGPGIANPKNPLPYKIDPAKAKNK